VVVSVKVLVNVCAFEPEIGAKVNHLAAQLKQRNSEFGGNTMRQGQKYDLSLFGEQFGFRFAETKRFCAGVIGKFREVLRKALSCVLAGGDGSQLDVWMRKKQPDEFFAGISGRADDRDFYSMESCHS
jgi:hypothetical protein